LVRTTIAAGDGHEHHREAGDAHFVAEISGLDLAQPLRPAERDATLEQAA
jgi:hypothetical protein